MKRELLFSFVGHVALFAVVGLVSGLHLRRESLRPNVITIQIVNPGSPQPAAETPSAHLVEPKPKAQAKLVTAPKPKPRCGRGRSWKPKPLVSRIFKASGTNLDYRRQQKTWNALTLKVFPP